MVKIPERAPDWQTIVKEGIKNIFKLQENTIIQLLIEKTDKFYYYWDKVRSQPLPPEFDKKEVWALIRFRRHMNSSTAPVSDVKGQPFTFWLTDDIQKNLHLNPTCPYM